MTAQLLAGQPVADQVLADVARTVRSLAPHGVVPGLGTILVGDDGASAGYVRKKHETCQAVGVRSFHADVAADAGVAVVIQPGGSVKDDAVIARADELGLAMVFTGERHFLH